MKDMFISINLDKYESARNDFITCGIEYDVIYQSDSLLHLKLYDTDNVSYYSDGLGFTYMSIRTTSGFIEVPFESIKHVNIH